MTRSDVESYVIDVQNRAGGLVAGFIIAQRFALGSYAHVSPRTPARQGIRQPPNTMSLRD